MRNRLVWLLVFLAAPVLTAQTRQKTERTTRVYDIAFLTRAVPQYHSAMRPSAGSLRLGPTASDMDLGAPIDFGGEPDDDAMVEFAPDDAPAGVVVSAEILEALIRRNISEDSWANVRNSIDLDGERLVVVQTDDVHARIDAFLAALRARRASMVAIEVVVVPASVLGTGVDASGPWITDELFAQAASAAGERATSVALTAYNEQTTSGLSGHLRNTVFDVEVNQTGVIPVVNPVVQTLPIGVSLEVRPTAIAGTDWFRVGLEVTRLEEAGEIAQRRTLFAEIEFFPLAEESVDTVLLVRAGRPAIAGRFTDRQQDGSMREFAVIARLTPITVTGDAPERPAIGGFHERVLDLSFLLEPLSRGERPLSRAAWLRVIRAQADPDAWLDERAEMEFSGGSYLHVTARPETHRAVREWVDARIRERARVATVAVSEYSGPIDAVLAVVGAAEGQIYLADDWRVSDAGKRLERRSTTHVAGALGCRLRARGFDARSFVGDVECVSGGTGFSIIEMPDPIVESAGNGFELDATVAPRLDASSVQLALEWARCRSSFESQIEFFPGVQMAANDGGVTIENGEYRGQVTVRMPYVIDLPSQRVDTYRASLPLAVGRSAALKVQKRRGGVASLLVARVEVTAADMRGAGEGGER